MMQCGSKQSECRDGLSKKIAAKGAIGEDMAMGNAGFVISLQRDDPTVGDCSIGADAD